MHVAFDHYHGLGDPDHDHFDAHSLWPHAPLPTHHMFPDAKQVCTSAYPEDSTEPQNTLPNASDEWVEVTHPLHPWYGRKFRIQRRLSTRGVPLARCIVDQSTLCSLPIAWTNLRVIDEFEAASSGQVYFRMDDLIVLRSLVDRLLSNHK